MGSSVAFFPCDRCFSSSSVVVKQGLHIGALDVRGTALAEVVLPASFAHAGAASLACDRVPASLAVVLLALLAETHPAAVRNSIAVPAFKLLNTFHHGCIVR